MVTRRELLDAYQADYKTPDLQRTLGSRLFPSVAFYARVAGVVLRESERARGGHFGHAAWRDAAHAVSKAFELAGTPILFENLHVLGRFDDPCVIIGNHMSTAETFILTRWLLRYRPVTYVVKQGLIEYPVFKHIMRACFPIVVGREDPRHDLKTVMGEGVEHLRKGTSVIIFPQRTRKTEFVPEEFNSIGVKLAKRAGVPVLPLALKTDAWSNGKRLKDFGPFHSDRPVHLALGEPMAVTGNGKEQNDAIISFIQERLAAWERWDGEWKAAGS